MTAIPSSPQTPPGLQLIRQVLRGDPHHGPPTALLILTAVTGLVEAVSILWLCRVFAASRTGNVVSRGFAVTGRAGFSLSASLFAVAGFLAGAVVGGTLVNRAGPDRALLLRGSAATQLVPVAAALAVIVTAGASLTSPVRAILAALLALAMGIQSAAARRLAVPGLTATVRTMPRTGIAGGLCAGNRGAALPRRLLVVITMLAGGLAGAWLVLSISPAAALGVAAGLLAIVAASAALAGLHPRAWRRGAR